LGKRRIRIPHSSRDVSRAVGVGILYPLSMPSLTGRVALVTGSSRGIGRSIALALAAAGADVAINFIHRKADAEAVEAEIRQMGRRSIAIQADVSSAHQVEALVRTVEQQLGPIDILINNA